MKDFYNVIGIIQKSQDFVNETGGLPEIARASVDLQAALGQTRVEIENAVFAERFLPEVGDYFRATAKAGQGALTPRTHAVVETEGEAGLKRETLRVEVDRIQNGLVSLLSRLVELRCDLVVSQQEFDHLLPESSEY